MRRSLTSWLRKAHTAATRAAAALPPGAVVAGDLADIEALRASLERADLYWVTGPMARVAMDAAQDVPSLRGEDCPTWDGLIVCAEPLPPIETATGRTTCTTTS